jgi:hypothetical protein
MLQTSQQVGFFGPFWVVQAALKLHWMLPFKEVFVAPRHPYHDGEARVHDRDAEEHWPRVFPSLPLSSLLS